jgi:hypothetical protein
MRLSAAWSTVQLGAEVMKAEISASSLDFRLSTTVSPDEVTGSRTTSKLRKSIWAIGELRSRLMLEATSAAVKGVPSEKVTPGRIVTSSSSPPSL